MRALVVVIAPLLVISAPLRAQPAAAPPEIDPASVVLFVDQGRLELRGAHLAGVRVAWPAPAPGADTCLDPKPTADGKGETCAFAVPRDAAATLTWGLPGAAAQPLHPARFVVDRLLPAAAVIDLTSGVGRIVLTHPELVASVDCASARCELGDGAVFVRAVSGGATTLALRLRLAPHAFVTRADAQESTTTRTVSVVHCAAQVASGPPLRHADDTKIVVRLDARCGGEARDLRWTIDGDPAPVDRVEKTADATFVVLAARDLEDGEVSILATRPEPDDSVVAVARAMTRPAPQPRATLELPGAGHIAFLPTNRDAVLRASPAGDHARFVPLPIEGAYRVTSDGKTTRVRGEDSAGGSVALRFGYRVDTLPPAFAGTDLAVLTEPLQRSIHEASVPAPLATSSLGAAPLLELDCGDGRGGVTRVVPGVETSIPFAARAGCRLVIHRERLRAEDGTQDLTIDVTITKVDDSPRADAHTSERLLLRPGTEPRLFWIHGVRAPFDRVTVRVSHVVDETRDVGDAELRANLPSAQWLLVVGQAHLRFYATAAIPTGLFRITAPSDVLTLNFGALSRLTWLDREGHEGLLGLELGAMGIGLAATPNFPRTLAILGGLGVGIPIGNRGETSQASVNLHAWIAYELRSDYYINQTTMTGPLASHWSFLFGPSITIGNVGTNL
ncbi:MAG TPA: hypothetical protein VH560_00015 [Polyangia bacterium]|nr:hypothetical protein [Polyangia bacterium]